jgi:hypothetical protein
VSSNLKIASFNRSVLEYKIVTDSALGLAPIVDVTGSSGTLYDISLDLSSGIQVATYYLKLWLQTATVTVGTTVPDLIFRADKNQVLRLNFPGGIPYTALSAALVSGPEDSNAAHSTTSNSGTIKITMVTS